ncbi:MAG: hypothetical protein EXS18_02465 [Verrucomicrobiae bacterium]|nr:hypothetical protein [Verrucomicrobiae bacterium]
MRAPDRARIAHLLAVPSPEPRRVDRAKLKRLAGSWTKKDADRIEQFIEESCEVVHAGEQ